MSFKDFLPFQDARRPKAAQLALPQKGRPVTAKLFKTAGLALGFTPSRYGPRAQFEVSPYDLDKIIEAADSDSYVKQAFNKYKELLWKEGWDIISENDDAVVYLHERLDLMELITKQPIQDLLVTIGDQLVKFGNAFVVKLRADVRPFVNAELSPPRGMEPIAGYSVLPAETVQILRDRNNRVLGYTQRPEGLVSSYQEGKDPAPTWRPHDVIHFAVDKKPGRVFGTPFMVAVIDDIIALRQMEEDIQNLVHKELFPLYKYTVGTEDDPANEDEIQHAINELDNLRTDGGLVLPERHDVDVIGAQNNALDASPYLQHFLGRVCVGLGLSPHHLGIMMEGGNRSVTDRLDVALYDKVKTYQRYISDMIRLHMFTELLLEAGYDPITPPSKAGVSDRCMFIFREIDVDTQVKKENHEINKFSSMATTQPELRMKLGMSPDADEDMTSQAIGARVSARYAPAPASASGTQSSKPNAAKPSTGGTRNTPNLVRKTQNRVTPSNQHGTRTSPNIRRSVDDTWLREVTELLDEDE